jgi:hypothetical protein
MPTSLVLVPLLALSATPIAQGQLWTVDAAGGADFTEIQAAVDASADGDTILVAGGTYAAVVIDGKALVLLGDEDPTVPDATIRNVPAGRELALRGFRGLSASPNLILEGNAGTVWLDRLQWGGPLFGFPDGPALQIRRSASVVVTRSTFQGWSFLAVTPGVDAVLLEDSAVSFHDVVMTGGAGKEPAASGLVTTNSFALLSGCTVTGGTGHEGGLCTPGNPGGAGIANLTPGMEPYLLDTTLAGGNGGCAIDCSWLCSAQGEPSVGGTLSLSGFARDYEFDLPAPAGGLATLAYAGVPGDLLFSVVSLDAALSFQPALSGALAVAPPPLLVAHGPVGPDGALSAQVPMPALPPGIEAVTVFAQGAALSASGTAVLAAPCQLTLL